MEEILLLNPVPKPSKRKGGKHHHRTAAQKRATARLLAWNRAHRGHKSHHASHRKAHKKSHHKAHHHSVTSYVAKHHKKHSSRRHHYSPNPIPLSLSGIGGMVYQAGIGALGAVAVDTAMAQLPRLGPQTATFTTGRTRYLTAGATALLLGLAVGFIPGGRRIARTLAEGSLTTTLRDAIKDVAAGAGLNLGFYSAAPVFAYPTPANQNLRGMGKFLPSLDAKEREARQMAGVGVYFHR